MNLDYSMNVGCIGQMMVPAEIRLRRIVLYIIIFESKVIRISFIPDYHVMEHNRCLHYHIQFSLVHVLSRAMDNGEVSLENSKCSFYILSNRLLTLGEQF